MQYAVEAGRFCHRPLGFRSDEFYNRRHLPLASFAKRMLALCKLLGDE
jgi:hypothetical protein